MQRGRGMIVSLRLQRLSWRKPHKQAQLTVLLHVLRIQLSTCINQVPWLQLLFAGSFVAL